MSKAKLQAARELIQEKNIDIARAVLETIPDDETSQKWLNRLPKASKPKKRRDYRLIIAVFIFGLFLGFAVGNTPTKPTTTQQAAIAPTIRPTDTPGPSPTITETSTPTNTLSPTQTPIPTNTPIPTLTPTPLIFSGAANQVIGPLEIEEGIYRATTTTSGYIIVSITASNGECGAGSGMFLTSGLFLLSAGEAANGAEALFTSKGCTALIEVSNTQAPWTLEFEKVG